MISGGRSALSPSVHRGAALIRRALGAALVFAAAVSTIPGRRRGT